MADWTYMTSGQCVARYPVIYHDADQPDKAEKYLVTQEQRDRWNNNWNVAETWHLYKGIITWNPCVYENYKNEYNMIYCDQFMNMYPERIEAKNWIPWSKRKQGLIVMYGPPASVDGIIMNARYDVPLVMYDMGMVVNAHGVIPDESRPEFRPRWKEIFRYGVPAHRKRDAIVHHKFGLSFENSRNPYYACGYVTEKIYDFLGSGCIPIYWGAPDVTDRIPPEVFIDYRDFSTPKRLYNYILDTPPDVFEKMSQDGLEFWDTVVFDAYLDVYEALE